MKDKDDRDSVLYGVYALLAGTFAALASVAIKIGLSKDVISNAICQHTPGAEHTCLMALGTLQVVFVLVGIFFNIAMWFMFSKALALSQSTIQATTANTIANFSITGILGQLLFGEPLSLLWCFGISLVILGLYFMNRSVNNAKKID